MKVITTLKKYATVGYIVAVAASITSAITLSFRKAKHRSAPVKPKAESPTQLPRQSWKSAWRETKTALKDKNIPMLAAGVAFFATLAFFPSVAAFTSIYSLVASPEQIESTVRTLNMYLPGEMAHLLSSQLTATLYKPAGGVLVAVIALALALWGASAGMQNLISATNRAYSVDETRGFVKLKLTSIALVIGGLLISFPLLLLLVVQESWLRSIGLPGVFVDAFFIIRWLLIVVVLGIALAAFYRYGPDRRNPKWQWVSWGAVIAILIWLIGSLLFFFYAQNFGNFGKNYGVLAGIIILMTWFNLSAFIFLLGAQVNHGLERQTAEPTEA